MNIVIVDAYIFLNILDDSLPKLTVILTAQSKLLIDHIDCLLLIKNTSQQGGWNTFYLVGLGKDDKSTNVFWW